jgi:hypothetical protein
MKLITVFFLLLPLFSLSQTPPKKATKVIVHITDSANTMMNKLAVILFEKGYTIEHKNDSLKLISTGEKSHPKQSVSTKLRISIKDTCMVFTGTHALDIHLSLYGVTTARTFDPTYYGGSKNSPLRKSWDELVDIAKEFGPITFSK